VQGEIAVSVENVSKKYCKSLKRSMLYGVVDVGKNIFGLSSHSERLRKAEFWAVDDVSFKVKKGEILGIIGPNGSGKTTLMKMINGIFWPDKGKITVRGRVGSLIGLGAGFHQTLTGRENIYLNAAILGMTRQEADEKYDDIIDFADIGDFIDLPVKFYSSGMVARLGFAVAVHLEPDILLVDEALSVGDLSFRKKCAEKIDSLKNEMTMIIVSHSPRIIYRMCDRALILWDGRIEEIGPADRVVSSYINMNITSSKYDDAVKILESLKEIKTVAVSTYNEDQVKTREFQSGDPVKITMEIDSEEEIDDIVCSVSVLSLEGYVITVMNTEDIDYKLKKGSNVLECKINELSLVPGTFFLKIKLKNRYGYIVLDIDAGTITVNEAQGVMKPISGYYRENAIWTVPA
jgi:lipopolysaccharide transport system ATP-binding protein